MRRFLSIILAVIILDAIILVIGLNNVITEKKEIPLYTQSLFLGSVQPKECSRTLMIYGEINSQLAMSIYFGLINLNNQNHEEITILINSSGGQVLEGLQILDFMDLSESPIRTICVGNASSMASYILAHGAKGRRMALRNSGGILHKIRRLFPEETILTLEEMNSMIDEIKRIELRLLNYILKDTGLSLKKIKNILNTERFYFADELKELGYIDKIITKKDMVGI